VTLRETVLQGTRAKIAEVYRSVDDLHPDLSPNDARNILVILGGSRSGSSFLFSLLADSGAFWSPQGEETPFYRLADLGWVDGPRDSDALHAPWGLATLQDAAEGVLRDLGRTTKVLTKQDRAHFTAQAATRLLMQWPQLNMEPSDVLASLQFSLEKAEHPAALWTHWLEAAGLPLEFYDLEGAPRLTPRLEFPDVVIEEPPFILQRPRKKPSPRELQSGVMLLKTSTNAYRIPLLRAMFPQARFQWLVLTRNPAASINGLMDGWRSGAFHSHNLRDIARLQIPGYSDTLPAGEDWWKFDLPPGWMDMIKEPLEQVCAFQWTSTYTNILRHLQQTSDPVHMLKFEELLRPETRDQRMREIYDFAKVPPVPTSAASFVRPVMASQPPGPARWRQRETEIRSALNYSCLRETTQSLGYDFARLEEWP
jgi:hypothetical protein